MISGIFENTSNAGKFLATIAIVLLSVLIVSFLGMIISIAVFDFDILQSASALSDISNPKNVEMLKFLQIVQSIGLFIVPPFIVGWLYSKNTCNYLNINKYTSFLSSVKVILIMICAMPLINFSAEINGMMKFPTWLSEVEKMMRASENNAQIITEAFLKVNTFPALLLNIFMIAVIPSIGEELLFRGVFQKIFGDWTKSIHFGIILSALLFSTMHFQFYGFIPRFLMGVLFGYLFAWSGSLWLPIIAHFANNLMAVLISYFMNLGLIDKQVETIGTGSYALLYVLISTLIVAFLTRSIYLEHKRIL